MIPWFFWCVTAGASELDEVVLPVDRQALQVGVRAGLGWRSRRLGLRVRERRDPERRLEPGIDVGLVSTQAWGERLRLATRLSDDPVDTTKVLAAPFVNVDLRGPFYVTAGSAIDLLGPVRAVRAVFDPDSRADRRVALAGLLLRALFSQGFAFVGAEVRLTAGAHLGDHVSVDAGLWVVPTLVGRLVRPSDDPLDDVDWLRATQPGATLSILF